MPDVLAASIVAAGSGWARIGYGEVVTTSPLTVRTGGSVVPVSGRLSSYTAVQGHVVALLIDSSNIIVLGRFVSP